MTFFKQEKIRKIGIVIFAALALLGAILIMNRGDPLDEDVGDVVVTNGYERIILDCHYYTYNRKGNSKEISTFIPIEKADNIPVLDYDPENQDNGLKVSYSDNYFGDLCYNVYDSEMNPVVENEKSLTMPVESGNLYYVEILVYWGEKDENVACKYYFEVNVK